MFVIIITSVHAKFTLTNTMTTITTITDNILDKCSTIKPGERYNYIVPASIYLNKEGQLNWDTIDQISDAIDNIRYPNVKVELIVGDYVPSVTIKISKNGMHVGNKKNQCICV